MKWLAKWARQFLAVGLRRDSADDEIRKKLEAIRAAAQHNFPAGDIESMLAEIESGYLSGFRP